MLTATCSRFLRTCGGVLAAASIVLLAVLAAGPASAALQPSGPEAVLDPGPATSCLGDSPDVAALGGGGFVTAWAASDGVWVRRLDAAGAPVAPPARVAAGEATYARLAALPDGGYALAWWDVAAAVVKLRGFDAVGNGGPVMVVSFVYIPPPPGGVPPTEGLDLAATDDGTVVVVWTTGDTLFTRRMGSSPDFVVGDGGRIVDAPPDPLAGFTIPIDPVVTIAGGTEVIAWTRIPGGAPPNGSRTGTVVARRFGFINDTTWPSGEAFPITSTGRHAALVPTADGGFVIAWAGPVTPPDAEPLQLEGAAALGYGPDDQPRAPGAGPVEVPPSPVRLDEGFWPQVSGTVATTFGDHFAVAWVAQPFAQGTGDPAPSEVQLREVNAFAVPLGPVVRALPDTSDYFGQDSPALAANQLGRLLLAFHTTDSPFPEVPSECLRRVRAQAFASAPCADGTTSLCAQGDRFELRLAYHDPRRGLVGSGRAVRLTDDTVYFWFFAAHKVEVVVKVIDGRGLNGHFWVFYGGLTDLGFTLLVRDTVTGASRTFTSPAGTMASRGVTDAFPPPAAARASADVELHELRRFELVRDAFRAAPDEGAAPVGPPRAAAPVAQLTDPHSPLGPCTPPGGIPTVLRPGLCLTGRRFEVEASWRDFAGNTGHAEGVRLAAGDDSGYFWFFEPANVELMVKVLDGRLVNGKFWVFYAALTNVEYDLRVRHVFGNGEATYHNPSGEFASRGDTAALTPPKNCGCPTVVSPVCGHDGRTYNNACEAQCFGWVGIAANCACGTCEPPPPPP